MASNSTEMSVKCRSLYQYEALSVLNVTDKSSKHFPFFNFYVFSMGSLSDGYVK